MGQNLIGILSLRDKLIRLIFEPTLDKVFSVFASTMLGTSIIAFFTTYTDPSNVQFIHANPTLGVIISVNIVIVTSFLLGATAALTALYYKRKNEPVLKQQDERDKSNKEWNYLFNHKHLKATNITLDKVDEWRKELGWLRNAVVSLIKYQVEHNNITNNEKEIIENPDALPVLPDIPDLSDEIIATAPSLAVTKNGEVVIDAKPKKSITQELNELESLEL